MLMISKAPETINSDTHRKSDKRNIRTNMIEMIQGPTRHATPQFAERIWIREKPDELRIRGINSREALKQPTEFDDYASLMNLYSSSSSSTTKSKRRTKYPVLAATRKTIEASLAKSKRNSKSRRSYREQPNNSSDVHETANDSTSRPSSIQRLSSENLVLNPHRESYETLRTDLEKKRNSAKHDPDRLSIRKVIQFVRTSNHSSTPRHRRSRPKTDTELYRTRKEQAREETGITCLPELSQQSGQGSLLYFGKETQPEEPPSSQSKFPAIGKPKSDLQNDNFGDRNSKSTNGFFDYKSRLNAILSARDKMNSTEYVKFTIQKGSEELKVTNSISMISNTDERNDSGLPNERRLTPTSSRKHAGRQNRKSHSPQTNVGELAASLVVEPQQISELNATPRPRYNFPNLDNASRYSRHKSINSGKRCCSNNTSGNDSNLDGRSVEFESQKVSKNFDNDVKQPLDNIISPLGDYVIADDTAAESLPLFVTTKLHPVPFPHTLDKKKLSKSSEVHEVQNEEHMLCLDEDAEQGLNQNKKSVINVFIPIS